ncbi:MAG: T9SS type A sorting domain-containing protein [Ignavibacteriae bacterium]|nr:T9SS type A sorting domain-containing protein [Ignavibacteriota bacterium]MCB9217504.1 T9SS type A sorting domain-containing protein [Ignavibacteria bacterium]
MRKLIAIITTGFILASVPSATQTVVTYYVSSISGDDSATGTAAAPFKTVQRCVNSWDDTTQVICSCAGTFNEEVVIRHGGPDPAHRSKLIAWDTDEDGSRDDETFVLDGQGIYNIAIEAPQGPRPDNVEIGWLTIRNYEPEGGCSSGSEVKGIKLTCVGGDGCSDWWLHDNVFEKIGQYCNTSANKIVIQPQHAPHLLVERNSFDSSGAYIMRYIQGNGITFRNNHVHMVAAGIEAWGSPDSLAIVNNIFLSDGNSRNDPDDPSCMGPVAIAFTSNVQHGLIKDNVFINCASSVKIGVSEEKGVRDNAFHTIEGNYIYRSDNVCDELNSPIIIGDCSDTSDSGDSIVVHDISIRNNIIRYSGNRTSHRGAAITLVGGHPYPFTSNINILNNTINGFKWGIRADECTSGGVPRAYQLNGVVIRNNIFSGIWGAFYTLERFGPWSNGSTPTNWVSDNNVLDSINKVEWNVDYTLTQWRSVQGQDVSSIQASPAFIAGDSTFNLAVTDTVAQNRGKSLADVMEDFSGRSRPMGGAWDIGAHEVVDKRIYFASATTGDDNYLGTADQPFRTIQRGLNLWNGTEQFELRGAGSFNEEAVVRYGGISADSMNAILPWDTDNDGSLDDETFVLDGQNSRAIAIATDSTTAPDFVEIDHLSFRNYAPDSCGQGEEARFVRLLGNDQDSVEGWSIHDNIFSNLASQCDLSTKQSAIRATWVKNLRVERNSFDSISGYLLNGIRGTAVDFRDNVATLIGAGVRTSYSVDSLRVVGNRFVGDGNGANGTGSACRQQWGVNLINGVQHSLISGNEFIGTSGGVRFALNESSERNNAGHIVEKNLIYMNDESCNAKRPGIVLADCSGVSDGGDSLWIEDVLVRNNVIVFEGESDSSNGGIKLASGHPYSYENDWRIYNNTIVGFKRGMLVLASEEEDGSPSEYLLNGVEVKNNLFSGITDAHYKFEAGIWEGTLPNGWASDYNVYGGVDRFRWNGKKSLTKWQRKTGQDAHSATCSAVFAANDSLYHLSNTDNCATDGGVSLTEVDADIDGDSRPSGGGYDVGADERTNGGLAKLRAGETKGEDEVTGSIAINPHPIVDRATITLNVPEEWNEIQVVIYDMLSRPVALLLPEGSGEAGEYELEWYRKGLASGLYMVVVESGEKRVVQQVVVE